MPALYDSHAHLSFSDYDKDLEQIIWRAKEAGLRGIVCIGSGSGAEGRKRVLELSRFYPDYLYPAYGIHPHQAQEVGEEDFLELEKLLKLKETIAIGEIGLDDVREISPLKLQLAVLQRQLTIAQQLGKPVIFHLRGAEQQFKKILKDNHWLTDNGFLAHCYTGSQELAKEIIERGGYLGVSGIVTFDKSQKLQQLFKELAIERLLLETDCPYLAPHPYRGRRNEPSFVVETAKCLAALKGLSDEDIARITGNNLEKLFKLKVSSEKETIAYKIRDSLYLNITNRCFLNCTFCNKRQDFTVKGHFLQLSKEPDLEQVVAAIEQQKKDFKEIVFCGYGEPLVRHQLLKDVASWLRKNLAGVKIRINSEGTAEFFSKQEILSGLVGLVDSFSISLNAADSKTYAKLCQSSAGEQTFFAVLDFINKAKKLFKEVVVTAVALPDLDLGAIEKLCREKLAVPFRPRPYNDLG